MSSIDRKPHALKPVKTLAMPRRIIFVDTETKPVELPDGRVQQILKLGVCCFYSKAHGRHLQKTEWQDFRDAVSFWDYLFMRCQPKQKLWVVARSLTFDFTVLKGWKYLRQAGYKLKFFHCKGSTSIISVRNKGKSILFVDSLNWFRETLTQTGERIGLPKLSIDFKTCTDSELLTYCYRDVEIELENFKLFMRFLESNAVSRLCYTLGSTAMSAYLLSHYHKKIFIHNNKEAIDLERASYRGGRVECFYIGDRENEKSYVVDVNSLYAFVMSNNLYPVKYKSIHKRISVTNLATVLRDMAVVAKVLINTDEPVYAIRRERTIFPVGRFWACLTTPELKYAFSHGHIEQVGECVIYEQADIFSSFVDRMYALRLKCKATGQGNYQVFCKYLLNSLYGKFGQKAETWEKIGDCPDEPDRVELCFIQGEHRTKQIRYLLGEIFELTGYDECFNSFPAISSHVTANGRLYLWELVKQAGFGHVFYCDTDSLIVDKVGLHNLENKMDSTKLGMLKLEEVTECLNIRGLKDYTTGEKNVVKGIRKNAEKLQENVYRQEKWPSFRGTLRGTDANIYTIETVVKYLKREYTKGNVAINGLVSPFVLDESLLYSQQPH